MQQIVGASNTSADLERASELRMRPSSLTLRFDHVAAWRTGAGSRAAVVPPTESSPLAPAGPSVVLINLVRKN
jgi:hypothetical protein